MALTDQIAVSKTISPTQHAVLDYGVAATFFALGMRYRGRNTAAATLAFINGGMVLGMSLFTDYPGGVWRKISFKTHGTLDVVQGSLAGVGPALFGFADEPEARAFYAQAVSEAGVVSMTDWNSAAGTVTRRGVKSPRRMSASRSAPKPLLNQLTRKRRQSTTCRCSFGNLCGKTALVCVLSRRH